MSEDASRQALTAPHEATLSVENAALLFEEAGIPKSTRTIQRYCRNGILQCIRTDAEFGDRYLINQASVERRIDELKKFAEMMASRSVAPLPDETRRAASSHATSRDVVTDRDESVSTDKRITALQAEIFNLKIDVRAKEIVIAKLYEERPAFIERITRQAARIGELAATLRRLGGATSATGLDSGLGDNSQPPEQI